MKPESKFANYEVSEKQVAKLGNQNALKFNTPEIRKAVCERLIAHLQEGWDIESFSDCDKRTIWFYMERFPEDFTPDDITSAWRRGRRKIEETLVDIATGKKQNGNAAAAIFVAKNKIGYKDRKEIDWNVNKQKSGSIEATADNLKAAQEAHEKLIRGEVLDGDDDDYSDDE